MVKLYIISNLWVFAFLLHDFAVIESYFVHKMLGIQQLESSCHPGALEEVQEAHVFKIHNLHERKDRDEVYLESARLYVMKSYLCQVSFWRRLVRRVVLGDEAQKEHQ